MADERPQHTHPDAHAGARLIALAADERGSFVDRISSHFPWMLALSPADRAQCATGLLGAARDPLPTGQTRLAAAVHAWEETSIAIAAGLGQSQEEWLSSDELVESPIAKSDRDDAYAAVGALAAWSDWAPFASAAPTAPLTPGVYQLRTPDGVIVYIGMAGERRGQGLRGRLSIYRRGKGAVSGFGEAALDRALADASFVEEHLVAVRAGNPARTAAWAQDAIERLNVEIRWAESANMADALVLERAAVALLVSHSIWNRVASRVSVPRTAGQSPEPSGHESGGDESAPGGPAITIDQLARELGHENGNAVRKALRAGFPDHVKGTRWEPLTEEQVDYVRVTLAR